MLTFQYIFFAVILDLLIGDPRRVPHIAVAAGRLAGYLETGITKILGRGVFAGVCFFIAHSIIILGAYLCLRLFCEQISYILVYIIDVIVIYQSIAARSLFEHVFTVYKPLKRGDIESARNKLSMIVGRDTESLNESDVSRAAIETTAESFNDGIIAPLFWAFLLGPFAALFYRSVNTLDSTVGYRDSKYEHFGRCSARMDDLLNYIPARFSAFLILVLNGFKSRESIVADAGKHASPNAGWPEAAMAYKLNVQLGGGNVYEGELEPGAVFNSDGRIAAPVDVQSGMRCIAYSYILGVVIFLSLAVWL